MKFTRINSTRVRQRGFSLPEMIVVIAVIGVLSALAIPHFGNTFNSSKNVVASEVQEALNLALKKHSQMNYKFVLSADHESSDDEIAIIRSLQWRDPVDPAMGSPYLPPKWNPVASNDINEHRLRWTGHTFHLLVPGDLGDKRWNELANGGAGGWVTIDSDGSGVKVDFEAGDYGENYTFPNDFAPVGG